MWIVTYFHVNTGTHKYSPETWIWVHTLLIFRIWTLSVNFPKRTPIVRHCEPLINGATILGLHSTPDYDYDSSSYGAWGLSTSCPGEYIQCQASPALLTALSISHCGSKQFTVMEIWRVLSAHSINDTNHHESFRVLWVPPKVSICNWTIFVHISTDKPQLSTGCEYYLWISFWIPKGNGLSESCLIFKADWII